MNKQAGQPKELQLEQAQEITLQRSGQRAMADYNRIEKFTVSELSDLREELTQTGLDSWQAGDVLVNFLMEHGYGVNQNHARDAVSRMESSGCSYECMQQEIERVALVM